MSPPAEQPSSARIARDEETSRDQADRSEPRKCVSRSSMSSFLNSAFGLWLLSSIVLSFSVYVYQQWQDYKHEQQEACARQDKLQIEIAGRLSQFGKWFKDNLLDKKRMYDKDNLTVAYGFRGDIDKQKILNIVYEFSDLPQHSKSGARVQEVFPEFSKRNMLSIYAELNSLNDRIGKENFIRRLCACEGLPNLISWIHDPSEDLTLYSKRKAEYKLAMVTILDPDYLFRYGDFDHDIFVSSFEAIFFTADIRASELPSTDCLERTSDCGSTPSIGASPPLETRTAELGRS